VGGDGELVEVIVVGGGLSGLLCARELRRAGYATRVLDAADAPGGRVRTDVVDGFRCDRGFQLLNPAYPAVRRHVDAAALDLRRFDRGVQVLTGGGLATLADPVRHPALLSATLRSGYLRPRELARLGAWLAPALGPVDRLLAGPDTTVTSSLDDARVEGRLRREVLEPFLSGVLAEDTGDSSATFVRLLLRSFVRATPAVPAGGMQALPDQLARGSTVTTGVRVTRVRTEAGGVAVEGDLALRARAVVVAADPVGAAALLGLPRPRTGGLRTWWFTVEEPPSDPRGPSLLRVDGRGRGAGPVVNTVVMSNAAPSYAPPGRHLVQATTLLPTDAGEQEVRRHLAALWGVPTDGWAVVTCHDVPAALPHVAPPLRLRRPAALGDGIFVAGDHRETSSIQGALVSGARAAAAVRRHLDGPDRGRR